MNTPLTAAEFRAWLHWLGIKPQEFATIIQVNERTPRAWASGRMSIPPGIRDEIRKIADEEQEITKDIAGQDAPLQWPGRGEIRHHYPKYSHLPERAILNAIARGIVEPTLYADEQ